MPLAINSEEILLPHGYTGRKFSFAPMCLRRRRPGEDHRAGLGVLQKPPLWWWTLTSAAPLLSISSHFWTTLGDIISARDKERQTAKRPPGCSCNCYLCWCKLGCRPLMYDDKPNLVFLNELCAIFFYVCDKSHAPCDELCIYSHSSVVEAVKVELY